jgi:hypothetical protein
MKTINVYFGAVTKVQVGHLEVSDEESIEDLMASWISQGFIRIHYQDTRSFIYVPMTNLIYAQYRST